MPETADKPGSGKEKPPSRVVVEALRSLVIRKRAKRAEEEHQRLLALSQASVQSVGTYSASSSSPPSPVCKKARTAEIAVPNLLLSDCFTSSVSVGAWPSISSFSHCPAPSGRKP